MRVPRLQTPGGVVYFFHDHRGKPIVSPALFEQIGEKFRKDMNDWAQANGVPVIRFKAGERKADVMAPYLDAAAASGRSQVAAVGCAQEFQLVWTARKHDTDPGLCPQFSFTKEQRRVSVFYARIWDTAMGSGFIKICTYFPCPLKAWVNGHEWAKRQALAAGIGFTALSNGFASCEDPAALQAICDRLGPGTLQVWFERWMARLPLPLTDADRDGGYWWELPVRQVETSRTLVFNDGVHARAFFEALLCENMDLGRPENAGLLFRRGQRSGRPTLPSPPQPDIPSQPAPHGLGRTPACPPDALHHYPAVTLRTNVKHVAPKAPLDRSTTGRSANGAGSATRPVGRFSWTASTAMPRCSELLLQLTGSRSLPGMGVVDQMVRSAIRCQAVTADQRPAWPSGPAASWLMHTSCTRKAARHCERHRQTSVCDVPGLA